MKLFKRIYFPVMGVLLALTLSLGFVDALCGGAGKTDAAFVKAASAHAEKLAGYSRDSYNAGDKEEARRYITDTLAQSMSRSTATKDDDGYDLASISRQTTDGETRYVPTFTVLETELMPETAAEMGDEFIVARTVTNVAAIVPGSDTIAGNAGQALIVAVAYDAMPGTEGAANASSVGVALQAAVELAKTGGNKNDVVFLFADAGAEGDYGAFAFSHQFRGFSRVVARTELTVELDSLGNAGSMTMYAGTGEAKLVGKYASVNKSGFLSSAVNRLLGLETAGGAFETPAISVGTTGGDRSNGDDTFANLSRSTIEKQAGVLSRVLATFGSGDLSGLDGKSGAVFFSYLNVMTIWYPRMVSYILGGVIIGLMAAVIAANYKKKAFGVGRSAAGAFIQLLTIAATVLSLFVAYYFVGLLCAGFGAFNIHAINELMFSNVGLLIGAMLLSLALSAAFNTVLKKTFFVKAADLVRGNVWLWAIVGAIMSFAAPELAYVFAIGAILELVVLLIVTLVRDKYRAKYGQAIERLFLYVLPLILVLPMAVSLITALSASVKLLFLPVIMIVFLLMAGFVTPYASYLVPVVDRAAKKLPKRKIRVERTFREERITDPAKPDKKQVVDVKKVVTERIDWNYRNWMGVTTVAVISCLVLILSSVFGGTVNASAGARFGYYDSVYDNSLVYVWSKTADGTASKTIRIRDTDAYKYMTRAISGYKWDNEAKAYVKTDNGNDVVPSGTEPSITFASGVYTVTPFDRSRSELRLTVTGASAVTALVFASVDNPDESYTVENEGEDTLQVRLPYGYGSFTMTTEGTTAQLAVKCVEHRPGEDSNIKNLDDWLELSAYYMDNEAVAPYLSAAIVLEYEI